MISGVRKTDESVEFNFEEKLGLGKGHLKKCC